MAEENQPELKTKQSFREKMWAHMLKEKIISTSSLCIGIPNFKVADKAAQRLTQLIEFKLADLLMVTLDNPQKSVSWTALENEKDVLIPKPNLLTGLFVRIKNVSKYERRFVPHPIIHKNGMKQTHIPVDYCAIGLKVDMVVVGSICVSKSGYRIGDGEGFACIEYAILSKMKAVNEKTVIVTTVHDCQILDVLPNELFKPHDIPVDIIVTPTQIIYVNPRLPKPTEIIWSIISKRRLDAMSILKEIKYCEERITETEVILKETDSDIESRMQERYKMKKAVYSKIQPKLTRNKSISDSVIKEDDKGKKTRLKSFLRKEKVVKSKENQDINDTENKIAENQVNAKIKWQRRRSNVRRNNVDFSLRLSNIASTVRVRELKNALLERGVKPSNITWRGKSGFCFLHFAKLHKKKNAQEDQPVQVDSIVANLQQLKIGETSVADDSFIIVEPAEPITKIEVTDISEV